MWRFDALGVGGNGFVEQVVLLRSGALARWELLFCPRVLWVPRTILCAAFVLLMSLELIVSPDDVPYVWVRCFWCWGMWVRRASRADLQWGVGSMCFSAL